MRELIKTKEKGMRAISLFIIQRDDATSFSPHAKMDLTALKQAQASGVEVWAYKCKNTLDAILLENQVPVRL